MKLSVNWVRFLNDKYGCAAEPAPNGIDDLVEKIGEQLGAVEEVIDVGKKYEGIVVVKVISTEKHPNADKLSVCLVDDGKIVKKVRRNKDGFVQIVHGAPNVKAGMLAAWIPPGMAVPSTFDKEPFVMEARKIRGIVSNGMLASTKELALGDDHEGIMEIDVGVKPGVSFTGALGLDDYIIDIENKMFTHRPDLFGILGLAREIAGIQGHSFKSPAWYRSNAKIAKGNARETHKLSVKNELPKLVPRFSSVVIKDVAVEPSPLWLRVKLNSIGIRPVNNIVDITNFYMYETAQPLHAYDYDKVCDLVEQKAKSKKQKAAILGIRLSKKGEKLKLLGGKEIQLEEGAIVITDGQRPIGLGSVMGGADTEMDAGTKTIILECASFDMNTTRQTAMKYGLFTDAATRFTKNQSPLQTTAVLAKAAEDVRRLAGGRVCGRMIDDNHLKPEVLKQGNIHKPVTVGRDFINSRLGLNLSFEQIKRLLTNVEFKIEAAGNNLTVSAPFWRTDIAIPEDIVEEVGRLYGYDKLPLQLPSRDLTPAERDALIGLKSHLRQILAAAGANEVLTYSFVHGSLLEKAGQDPKQTYHIRNALSPDLQYYRLSLAPSLLEKVHPNIKQGFEQFGLFEIGTAHVKGVYDNEKLPVELQRLAVVRVARDQGSSAPFYQSKYTVSKLFNKLNIYDFTYVPLERAKGLTKDWRVAAYAFEPSRTAAIFSAGTFLGLVGEPSLRLKTSLKLPANSSQAELDVKALYEASRADSIYRPLNRYPSTDQDITLRSSVGLTYAELTHFLNNQLAKIANEHGYGLESWLIDIYQRPNDRQHKQTTWRIRLWHPERTLTTAETSKVLDKISARASKELKAERI